MAIGRGDGSLELTNPYALSAHATLKPAGRQGDEGCSVRGLHVLWEGGASGAAVLCCSHSGAVEVYLASDTTAGAEWSRSGSWAVSNAVNCTVGPGSC